MQNNETLKNEYVTLMIGDSSKYQEAALLVDRPDFLRTIKAIRERMHIEAPLVDVYEHFADLFAGGWKKEYQRWIDTGNLKTNEYLLSEVKRLLARMNKPKYLLEVVLQTIFFKYVIDYSSLVQILNKGFILNDSVIGIFPTINTTTEEVDEALRQVRNLYKTFPGSCRPKRKRINIKTGFRTTREWYWRNVCGESYRVIALSLDPSVDQEKLDKNEYGRKEKLSVEQITFYQTVKQALVLYKKSLKE